MSNTLYIFSLIQIIIFVLIIIFAIIYSIPIIFIRRFHQPNKIFTLNVCVATILCCLSWLPYYGAFLSDKPNRILVFTIAEIVFTTQVPLSFVVGSLHRYCSLVYHTKLFFKRKQWIILCIGSQWVLGFVLSVPSVVCLFKSCGMSVWSSICTFGTNVLIPLIVCLTINLLIYRHVRSSTSSIQPQTIAGNVQQLKISHRDIVLLRRMVLMFCVFIGGWSPIFLVPIIEYYTPVHTITRSSLTIWCELTLLFDIIDLFLYNRELRRYFVRVIF